MSKLAIIQIRGTIGVRKEVVDTLNMLHLKKKHACVIVPKTPTFMGMVKKVEHFVTFGDIDEETEKLLKEKREKTATNKEGKKVAKKFFSLHPPIGGFERKGIKKSFNVGGVLGNRGVKINDLIKRMV
tara:strand:+ start:13995 stop:14378 length:384 start_codon:yes stop_codon:yes gene_type:complete